MNTSQIKNFAIASRNLLKAGVIQRFQVLGFDAEGNLTKGMPTRIQGGATLFAGQFLSEDFYDKWTSLYEHVQQVGVKEVYEEAAYTWFNRLVAIRIMQKNHFIDPVLAYTNEEARLPRIVAEARAGHIATEMLPADRARLQELLGDDSKLNEQFALLIENYCRFNPVIYNCFGGIEQYISLLLPDNILAPGGFIDLLNHTSYITDDDYKQSELIGWLYQFYIAEKKDEVFDGFKKGKKAEAEDIPAATQIFTPNWIVKYMVQNTLGRIYLDNNPYSEIKSEMKYLVETATPTPKDSILKIDDLAYYKLLDPASGSGHILLEGFDLLYKMYLEEAYSSRVAIESIFKENLVGIDIDTRAKQLATFSLLMKAALIDPSFLNCNVMPRVLDMPGTSFSRPLTDLLREFYMSEDHTLMQETYDAFELLKQAHNLGSIMRFTLSDRTRKEMALRYEEWGSLESDTLQEKRISDILPSISLILALTDKYTAVVANPPYMGASNMNDGLKSYIFNNYPIAKYDLFSVFIEQMLNLTTEKARMGCITMEAWMFLSSFEEFRKRLIDNNYIVSLSHFGWHIIGIAFGTAMTIFEKDKSNGRKGEYSYLTIDDIERQSNTPYVFPKKDNHRYSIISQHNFDEIPGSPVAYWVGKSFIQSFKGKTIDDYSEVITGMTIGKNELYLRLWSEVSLRKVALGYDKMEQVNLQKTYWIPYSKGGVRRQWYGNYEYLVNWSKKDSFNRAKTTLSHRYLQEAVTWPFITSAKFSARFLPAGSLWDVAGSPCFFDERRTLIYTLGFLASKLADMYLNIMNPTINVQAVDIRHLPLLGADTINESVISLTNSSIEISKTDWDAHETSWDFRENELVRIYKENHGEGLFFDANRLVDIVSLCKEYWTSLFDKLHANEEEINRLFIDIYGLQDEITPDVPLDDITILQQGEISIENGAIIWHDDVLVKQLISYAIGCMMGRYRLDRPGLHIAYPNPSPADVEAYEFQGEEFEIDDDGIIPLLGRDCAFEDNAYNRVVKFLSQVFGDSFLNENLNFIESALGKSVEDYLVKDFWKDHKKMYSNRPIYWLFSSKKGAFQCLAYMHRMNPYTAEIVRSKYLLPYIDYLKGKIAEDTAKAASLSTVERRNLDKMQVALAECLEYEERLHNVADSQIGFDLDDGVVVNYAKFGDILAKIK